MYLQIQKNYDIIFTKKYKKGSYSMNQILYTENKNKNKAENKKVIIVFAIIAIVFAAAIIGVIIYNKVKEGNENKPIELLNKPTIKLEAIEQNCKIEVEYTEGLSKVIYSWNKGDVSEKTIEGTEFQILVEIPEGSNNTLYVKAIGKDNSQREVTQEFKLEGVDQNSDLPEIIWERVGGTNNILVKATSQKGIDNITYEWEGDEKITISANGEEEFETEIEIKRGTNKLLVTATDIEGNTQSKDGNIVGIHLPEIDVYITQDRILHMKVTHDTGFKKVEFKVNENVLLYDEEHPQYSKDLTELTTELQLSEGRTIVKITAESLENEASVKTYEGEITL